MSEYDLGREVSRGKKGFPIRETIIGGLSLAVAGVLVHDVVTKNFSKPDVYIQSACPPSEISLPIEKQPYLNFKLNTEGDSARADYVGNEGAAHIFQHVIGEQPNTLWTYNIAVTGDQAIATNTVKNIDQVLEEATAELKRQADGCWRQEE